MQPQEYDAVLGDTAPSPAGAVVLGGLEGVKQRLQSEDVTQRIAAIREAQKYQREGLDLIIQGLQDRSLQVQKAAYFLLQGRKEGKVRRSLQVYNPYPLFECLSILEGHRQGITAVAIAPDNRTIVSSSRDYTIQVWDWWAGEAIFSMRTNSLVFALTISADGESVIIRDQEQTIRSWSLRTGEPMWGGNQPARAISSVTMTADEHLVSGSQNLIKVWNLTTGREICTLQGHTSLVTSVAVSRDRQFIASGSEDKTIRIWGIG